jgi:nucleoside-diphosphate-sugar epimerase
MDKTILVTGATGYVGSWIVKYLLEKGYKVRITVRDKSKTEKYAFLQEFAADSSGEIEVFAADLLIPGSYNEAVEGSEAIIHVASPFTLHFKDPIKECIKPAIKGTGNILAAASASESVKKVVLTSSVAAVYGDAIDMKAKGLSEFTEKDFNDTSTETHQPYSYSKVKAEQTAWELAKQQNQWQLVVINPSFVMGPPLTVDSASGSIQFMKEMLTGKYLTGAPHLEFGFVDVRDVARAHILALENNDAEGRHILVARVLDFMGFANTIKSLYPGKYPLPLMKAPKFFLYLIGWAFNLSPKFVANNIGHQIKFNNSKSKEALGLEYLPIETTVKDMVERMKELKIVKS